MGLSLRMFINEGEGALTRIPTATFFRWHGGQPLPTHRAGVELKMFEVVVEVERRNVIGVRRVLPYRMRVRGDGRLDTELLGQQAMRRMSLSTSDRFDLAEAIAELEASGAPSPRRSSAPSRPRW